MHRLSMSFPPPLIADARELARLKGQHPTAVLRQATILGMMQLRLSEDKRIGLLTETTKEKTND